MVLFRSSSDVSEIDAKVDIVSGVIMRSVVYGAYRCGTTPLFARPLRLSPSGIGTVARKQRSGQGEMNRWRRGLLRLQQQQVATSACGAAASAAAMHKNARRYAAMYVVLVDSSLSLGRR